MDRADSTPASESKANSHELVDPNAIRDTRTAIERHGVDSLEVDNLTENDLYRISWSGGSLHLKAVGEALERAKRGEVEYLVVRAPGGYPVSIGGIDYAKEQRAGSLWQLTTHGQLRSLGLGSRLIGEAEMRIKNRGLDTAVLSIEDDNFRAKALYERLGYNAYGHEQESWDEADQFGNVTTHRAEVTLMRKTLV
jgi:ribosomal protein S18 acetylase RimI-like enzyme